MGSNGSISKYQFALEINKKYFKNEKLLIKSNLENSNLFAPRPKNMVMDVFKFEKSYNVILPDILKEIKNTNLLGER